MATLTKCMENLVRTLSEDERRKFRNLCRIDEETKRECLSAGVDWDQETESTALGYLRTKIKKRRNLAQQPGETGSRNEHPGSGFAGFPSIPSYFAERPTRGSSSSRSESTVRVSYNSSNAGSNNKLSESENEYESADSSDDYRESAGQQANNEGLSPERPIKEYPRNVFHKIQDILPGEGGLFGKVALGHIRGQRVLVKTFHATIQPTEEKLQAFKKIFRTQHRNLIPMLGMIDTKVHERPQLVCAVEENEQILLEYLRSKNSIDPKGYAMFGKFSMDIINGMEYLHTNGIVHGFLCAGSIIVRRGFGCYQGMKKIHLNCYLDDYGVILLTDGLPNRGELYKTKKGGFTVPLRWSSKEVVESAGAKCDYTFQSDVWNFGVVLWEMWTHGDVPYGKNKPLSKVEKHILDDCNPLTILTPLGVPRHILEVIASTFNPVGERPSFMALKQKFVEFHKFKFEHSKKLQDPKQVNHPPAAGVVGGDQYKKNVTKGSSAESISLKTAKNTAFPRVREWYNKTRHNQVEQRNMVVGGNVTNPKGYMLVPLHTTPTPASLNQVVIGADGAIGHLQNQISHLTRSMETVQVEFRGRGTGECSGRGAGECRGRGAGKFKGRGRGKHRHDPRVGDNGVHDNKDVGPSKGGKGGKANRALTVGKGGSKGNGNACKCSQGKIV